MSDKKKQNTEQTGKMNTAAETGAAEDIAEDVNAAPENGNGAEDSGQAEENTEAATDAKCAGAEAEESADVKYLRLAADFQNYKRRMEKERFERYSEGKKDFASELLPVLDNFERAIAQDAEDAGKQFHEGMEMILTQLQDVLKKAGIEEISATGEDFDPNFHNAVMMESTELYESGKVSEVMQKGYRLGEKVIRPAMVKVSQ